MPVHTLDHPLAAHIITHLRDKTTKPATFRTLAYQISLLLAIEATSNVETEARPIETPLEPITGKVLDPPLAAHIITHLRDKTTKPATFRTLAYQISLLLAIEATSELETETKPIETPLEPMTGRVLAHESLVVVPILRAGLGM